MSDREVRIKTDFSPRRDDSPRDRKEKSYSRSPSRGRKSHKYDRDHRRDDRDRDYSSRRDRSRSRSRSDKRRKSSRHSRSQSRSPGYGRSHSHSPMSSRRRHMGTRDNPNPNTCLGIFGLSVYTNEDELYHIFSKYGPVERVQVVIDAKTGRSRGFAFVYFEKTEDAKVAKEECCGMKINDKNIRVDFSITERAHTPTPGIYMGKPTYKYSDRYGDKYRDRRRDRDSYYRSSTRYRRSPSPYYSSKSRRRYSRSRSYSPRR
ncbi:transformer-2 protein homolog beta isoform X2 [Sitophilus oryzae]|uniref:Transformer-2 protein homolog beta isoform X2 n=1 Tax=Sitophilus oryzae TaxID=7048 RepID=A0A6J2Y964_SITOR|nr:transformer-2 protein homolog beta isoform X2 [Sitophilus oryzae]